MIQYNRFSVAGRVRAFGYAIAGVVYAFKVGHAIWLQSIIAGCVVALGFYLNVSANDWRWISAAIALVLTAEIINTAIESVCDALHPEHHPLIGKAKDAAAGAVLMAGLGAAIIGALTFLPYLF